MEHQFKCHHYETVKISSGYYCDAVSWITEKKQDFLPLLEQIKSETDYDKKRALKVQLPAMATSGCFKYTGRSKENFQSHSGLIAIDIDKFNTQQTPKSVKAQLSDCDNVAYSGYSASGNVVAFIRVPSTLTPESHELYFQAIHTILFESMGIDVDLSGSDVCRARYYAYDPEAYVNRDAESFKLSQEFIDHMNKPKQPKDIEVRQPHNGPSNHGSYAQKCIDNMVDKKGEPMDWEKGNRHKILVNTARALRDNTECSQGECESILLKYKEEKPYEEIRDLVDHTYNRKDFKPYEGV